MVIFGGGHDRRRMEALAQEFSRRSNRPLWGWRDSNPAPCLAIDMSGPEQVLITIQESQFVLFLDDGERGSIPARQLLGHREERVEAVVDRFVDTLRHFGRHLHSRGDRRFRRFVEFDMYVAETFGDAAGELEAALLLGKDAWDHLPDNPTTLNPLVSVADRHRKPKLKAAIRVTQGHASLALAQRGEDPRFTLDQARMYFDLALDVIDTVPGGYDALKADVHKTLREKFPR